MAKADQGWKVLPHGRLQRLAENLWWVEGSLKGMSLKRVMTIARLPDGRLVIHNAVALQEDAMREIEAWGTPAFLIVPSAYHRLDAPAYKQRYPQLRVLCPTGARAKVEQVIKADGTYEDFPHDEQVRFETLRGLRGAEGAMIVRSPDGVTLVLNDCVMNMDKKRDLPGYLFTTLLGSAPGPRISRLTKLALIKDKPALRGELQQFAQLPGLVRLIVAHEKVAAGPDASAALRTALTYL